MLTITPEQDALVRDVIFKHLREELINWTPINEGVSGSQVNLVVTKSQRQVVVKNGKRSIIQGEITQYQQLTQHLKLPQLLGEGEDYLVLELFDNCQHFFSGVRNHFPEEQLKQIFLWICGDLSTMWKKTGETADAVSSGAAVQVESIEKTFRKYFPAEHWDLPLVVNGVPYNISIQGCLALIKEGFQRTSRIKCLNHGDPRGDNLLFRKQNYRIIDPRPGYLDWVDDLNALARFHMYCTTNELSIDPPKVVSDQLHINYRVRYPDICHVLEEIAWQTGKEVAQHFEDETWRERTHLFSGASLLREIAMTDRRGRRKIISVVSNFQYFLLGKAVYRHFSQL